MRKTILYILVLLMTTTTAHSEILNVPSQYQTIQAAADAVNEGDTIRIADGIYTEHIHFHRSGTPENWITVEPAPGANPIIQSPMSGSSYQGTTTWIYGDNDPDVDPTDCSEGRIKFTNVAYMIVRGLTFYKVPGSYDPVATLSVVCNSHDIKIDGNTFYNGDSHQAIKSSYFYGASPTYNLDFTNNYLIYDEHEWIEDGAEDEYVTFASGTNYNISNNYISGSNGIQMVLKGNIYDSIVSYNTVLSPRFYARYWTGSEWYYETYLGFRKQNIYLDGGWGTIQNVSVFNNYAEDGQGIVVNQECNGRTMNGVYVYNNIINSSIYGVHLPFDNKYGGGACDDYGFDSTVYNLYVYGNTAYDIKDLSDTNYGVYGLSNVYHYGFSNLYEVNSGGVYLANNLLYGTFSSQRYTPVQLTGATTLYNQGNSWNFNPANPDPGFMDATTQNFHLNENSYAIDAGVSSINGFQMSNKDFYGNNRPNENGWDIGASEFGISEYVPAPVLSGKNNTKTYTNTGTVTMNINEPVSFMVTSDQDVEFYWYVDGVLQ